MTYNEWKQSYPDGTSLEYLVYCRSNNIIPDFRNAELRYADLRDVNLEGVNLEGAYLFYANLKGANLKGANLKDAYLKDADLAYARVAGANLIGAVLSGTYLTRAVGLPTTEDFMRQFRHENGHYYVYKLINNNGVWGMYYPFPEPWKLERGAVWVDDNLNTDRRISCGRGINFATLEWCKVNKSVITSIHVLRIPAEKPDSVVVPYATAGTARSGYVEYVGTLEEWEK